MDTVKKEVEKVLLHTDESELRRTTERAVQATRDLNAFLRAVESELGRKLKPDEMERVKDDPFAFFQDSLTFPLPKADEKMRFDALGIDIWLLRNLWDKRTWGVVNRRTGLGFVFVQEGNGFRLADDQPMYEVHKKYATPRQLEILGHTRTLCKALNLAADRGLNTYRTFAGANTNPLHRISDTFKCVRLDENTKKMVPDLERIAHMP